MEITLLLLTTLLFQTVHANVEKTIFLAPSSATVPSVDPALDDLGLERLSPLNPVLRTTLNASFPTTEKPLGTDSWFFLENLNPGQRYEVRICWLATQPASFTLTTHTLSNTIESPPLLSSLTYFSHTHLSTLTNPNIQIPRNPPSHKDQTDSAPTTDSVLFLQIQAAADYFSTDASLMQNVPPIVADVILDPFLLNFFPKSLIPTAWWILGVTVVAVFVARWVSAEFGRVVESGAARDSKKEQ